MESFLWDEFWPMHQFPNDSTTDHPLSQENGVIFVVLNLNTTRLAAPSLFRSCFRYHLKTIELLDKDSKKIVSHSFKNNVEKIVNSVYTKTIIFCRPVVTMCSILQAFWVRWNFEKTIFSKLRGFFDVMWSVSSHCCAPKYYIYQLSVRIGWHPEYG